MRLYNTLGREIETLPTDGRDLSLYVCGITPYDTTHLGHARTYVVFDVLLRYLRHLGHRVRYVQNITDVDDPLFERARKLGQSWDALADEYVTIFANDMAALNVVPADAYPRVSESIPQIVETVAGLEEKGSAYARDGHVYFRVASSPDYGQFSRLDRPGMVEEERQAGEDPDDPRKEDPLDFLLWKPSQSDEPSWPSPWGPGRPGWHVECSTFVLNHLGPTIDLHGGGEDLIFPHHENEIAQSESYTGHRPFARYWVHIGLVKLDGVKMSKSLGNMVFARDLLASHPADAIRLYLLSQPYREPLDYRDEDFRPFVDLARDLAAVATADSAPMGPAAATWRAECLAALDSDLDTPQVLRILRTMADSARVDEAAAAGSAAVIREVGGILGLSLRA